MHTQAVPPAFQIIQRPTNLTRSLEKVQPGAADLLTVALQEGITELTAADPNDIWNVTARFWPATCSFTRSDHEGYPGFGQDCFPSELLHSGKEDGLLRMVEMGHASVVVSISLVPYIRARGELSVHALTSALLHETERVVQLGLPVHEHVQVLFQSRHFGEHT